MESDEQTRAILAEIRDHTRESLAMQKEAMESQRKIVKVFYWVVTAAAVVAAGLIVLLIPLVGLLLWLLSHTP